MRIKTRQRTGKQRRNTKEDKSYPENIHESVTFCRCEHDGQAFTGNSIHFF